MEQSPGGVSCEAEERSSVKKSLDVSNEDKNSQINTPERVKSSKRVTFSPQELHETNRQNENAATESNGIKPEKTEEQISKKFVKNSVVESKAKTRRKRRSLQSNSSSTSSNTEGDDIDLSKSPLLQVSVGDEGMESRHRMSISSCLSGSDKKKKSSKRRSNEAKKEVSEADIRLLSVPLSLYKTSRKKFAKLKEKMQKKSLRQSQTLVTFNESFAESSRKLSSIFSPESVFFWNSAKVASFLHILGLKSYASNFIQEGVNGATLLELSREQFKKGLGIEDEAHLTSLEMGILALLCPRSKSGRSFFEDWSLEKTLQWVEKRGFGILKDRFKEKAVHGGVLHFLDLDFVLEKVLVVDEVTTSSVIKSSLKASVLRARLLERSWFPCAKVFGKCRRSSSENRALDWGIDEVESWLKTVNVGHRKKSFEEHCVNGTMLLKLQYKHMQEMGLSEIMSIVLIKALNNLKRENKQPCKPKPVVKEDEVCVQFREMENKYSQTVASLTEADSTASSK